MVFHRSLSDSNSPYVFKSLQDVLAECNNSVVLMVPIFPRISCSFSFFPTFRKSSKCINYEKKKRSLARFKYLAIFLHSFIFTLWSAVTAKSTKWQVLYFLLINTRFDFSAGIWKSICISKSLRILQDRFYFMHISFRSIVHPIVSCLLLFLC